jgi:hypothetical protein
MRREANPTDHKRTRRRRRPGALPLLLLWLLAWSAWALEPCCEALAAVIPHHHETGAALVQEGYDHAAHHDDSPASKQHTHCPNAKPVDLNTPAPIASTGGSYRIQTPLYLPASRVAPVLSLTPQPTVLRLRYRFPPPISVPPFLVQRLLI